MINVKIRLKELQIKLGEFANALEISRPTLYNYIDLFEKGEIISNNKYQCIFEKLFDDGVETKDEFMDILKNYHRLLERDKVLGTLELDAEKTDLMTSIIERMKKDLEEENFDESIYVFINMLIGSYRKVDIFKKFANYFLYLNGVKELENIKKNEKPFISNCYKLMHLAVNNKLKTNESYLNQFIERVNELKVNKTEKREILKEKIFKQQLERKLNEIIKEQVNLGIDIEDIDIEQLIKKIDFSDYEKFTN